MLIEMNSYSVTLLRKRIKNINLRIGRTGQVQISAPLKTPLEVIHRFLQNKHAWIEMHRSRLLQSEPPVLSSLFSGKNIYFQGDKYELHLHETDEKPYIELHGNKLHLFAKPDASESQKEWLLKSWYHAQMEQCLSHLFYKWQSIMGVKVNRVTIKDMKSRWGSCQPIKKYITLNLKLIEKPTSCLEYVVVHELVHLFEASHNQRFYALMSHYLPEWKQIKKCLAEFS